MPFGLRPNVAAGLASLFSIAGGIVMLAAGATHAAVRWSAAQAAILWSAWFAVAVLLSLISWTAMPGFGWVWPYRILNAVAVLAWIFATAGAFRGRMVRIPLVAPLTEWLIKDSTR